jgi:hypothetical protein
MNPNSGLIYFIRTVAEEGTTMELTNPTLVCTTPTNIMAHEVAEWLSNAGISAQVMEGGNPLGGVENAGVMVSALDHPRALEALQALQQASRPQPSSLVDVPLHSEWIDVRCDRCGHEMRFPPIQKGSVENCPNCFAFIDIGSDVDYDDWNVLDVEGEQPEGSGEE